MRRTKARIDPCHPPGWNPLALNLRPPRISPRGATKDPHVIPMKLKTSTLRFPYFFLVLSWLLSLALARAAEAPVGLLAQCTAAMERFTSVDPDMKKLFETATGYVVFPSIAKGGFVFGGARGEGLAYEKGAAVGKAVLTQVTVGAQVGGQEFAEVIFFESREAFDSFKQSKLTMSAQVSAVAAAEGASKNARYMEGVLIFTRAKQGLMAEARVGGQKLKFEALK